MVSGQAHQRRPCSSCMHPRQSETNNGWRSSHYSLGPEQRVTEPSRATGAVQAQRPKPRYSADYKLLRVPSPVFPFMTLNTHFTMNRHLHPSNTSHTDRFRSLDRVLAAKYVQLVMAHRRRVQSQAGDMMRPRCVLSFVSPFYPDVSCQRGNMRST